MKYKVGDKVRIKTWRQMQDEFGLDADNAIDCFKKFTTVMESSLPRDRIITLDRVYEDDNYYISDEFTSRYCTFLISDDMIEGLAGGDIPKKTYEFEEELI